MSDSYAIGGHFVFANDIDISPRKFFAICERLIIDLFTSTRLTFINWLNLKEDNVFLLYIHMYLYLPRLPDCWEKIKTLLLYMWLNTYVSLYPKHFVGFWDSSCRHCFCVLCDIFIRLHQKEVLSCIACVIGQIIIRLHQKEVTSIFIEHRKCYEITNKKSLAFILQSIYRDNTTIKF